MDILVAERDHPLFHFFGQTHEVDIRAAARRTGDEGQSLPANAKGFQDFYADSYLLDRICRKGDSNSIADTLCQKGSNTDR